MSGRDIGGFLVALVGVAALAACAGFAIGLVWLYVTGQI